MARRSSSSRSSAPKRSSVPTKTSSAVPSQPQAQSRQPGLFGQMASTAAGVAVGSTVGHVIGGGISNMLFGGSSREAAPAAAPPQQYEQQQQQNFCEPDQRAFMKCLETNSQDITACQYYLDAFKQCQQTHQL